MVRLLVLGDEIVEVFLESFLWERHFMFIFCRLWDFSWMRARAKVAVCCELHQRVGEGAVANEVLKVLVAFDRELRGRG